MHKKFKKTLALTLIAAMALSASAMATNVTNTATHVLSARAQNADTRASYLLSRAEAGLTKFNSSTMRLSYKASAFETLSVLGLKTVTIYNVTAGTSRTYADYYFSDTSTCNAYINFAGTAGQRYYATVTFYAESSSGKYETTTVTTSTIKL